MGVESYSFADGFEYSYLLRYHLERMVGKSIPFRMFTDSQSLFEIIVKSSTTTEKSLTIDAKDAREAYDAREISDIGWVPSEQTLLMT